MLESQSNRTARFARAAAGQLHKAAVLHVLKPRFRGLANNWSSENRPSADGKNENRQFGKADRIAISDDCALSRHNCTRLWF